MTNAATVTRHRGGGVTTLAVLLGVLALCAAVHLVQGTAAISPLAVWKTLLGVTGDDHISAVIVGSRLPRLLAGLVSGVALAAAGAALQGITSNPLASPDTLGVGAGAGFALALTSGFGISLPVFGSVGIAFVGGLAAALMVFVITGGSSTSPTRLVLAGAVAALALGALTSTIKLFRIQQTSSLFMWGGGTLNQAGLDAIVALAPVATVSVAALIAAGRTMDLLALGDDAAASLGVRIGISRAGIVVLAVLLSATAVTLTGPLGFVGLAAPASVRSLRHKVPALLRHSWFVAVSAIFGAALVICADVLIRAIGTPMAGVDIPTGVLTTILGASVLVVMARRVRSADGRARPPHGARPPLLHHHQGGLLLVLAAVLIGAMIASLLLGDALLLLGDVGNYLSGQASERIDIVLSTRIPRIAAAVGAGACLAFAGAIVQSVTRNPLADPGLLGVTSGAGLGAVVTVILFPAFEAAGGTIVGAGIGALTAAGGVFLLARSADPVRIVLVGVGVAAAASAFTTLLLARTDPWNQAKAITWLGGSTYGAQWADLIPMLVIGAMAIIIGFRFTRDLDILQLDDITPRLLGLPMTTARVGCLLLAVALTAAATAGIGVISFVGLVAPHAARALVGSIHRTLLPTAALLGSIFVLVADTLGRTVVAPSQIPAGLVTALIGAPYFFLLLRRVRV